MNRYFRIYRILWRMSLETLLIYRANFINSSISSFAWGIFSYISIFLLTSKTSVVFGWTRGELILLTCGYGIMIGIFHTLFSRNFERMAEIIDFAQLDSILIKPIDSQFFLTMRWINYASIIRIVFGVGFLFYFLHSFAIRITIISVLVFFIFLFLGVLLLYSLWFGVATLLLWFPRLSNLMELMYTVAGLTRYPGEMYKNASEYLFLFLLPLTLIVSTPVKFLVWRASGMDLMFLIFFAVMLFLASRKFWVFALRFYTSASS